MPIFVGLPLAEPSLQWLRTAGCYLQDASPFSRIIGRNLSEITINIVVTVTVTLSDNERLERMIAIPSLKKTKENLFKP